MSALNESFVTTSGLPGSLTLGVYHTFSTAGGDAPNPLAVSASSLNFFAHPSLVTGAQNRPDGGSPDLAKGVPILRNEELILLRAEANIQLGNAQAAIDDINLIRTQSGGLAASTLTAASPKADLITELLYNRTYSLTWESGTRWLDARRFGRLASLPRDRAGDQVFTRMPIPTAEYLARSLTVSVAVRLVGFRPEGGRRGRSGVRSRRR